MIPKIQLKNIHHSTPFPGRTTRLEILFKTNVSLLNFTYLTNTGISPQIWLNTNKHYATMNTIRYQIYGNFPSFIILAWSLGFIMLSIWTYELTHGE